jgi:twinkle protein
MIEAFASPAFTVAGSRPAFTTKEHGMLSKLPLSIEHAAWLETERKIRSELAAEMGVVSKGKNLAFEYRRNGAPVFLKVRKEMIADGGTPIKTFWIEPKGVELRLWNEDCLSEPSGAPLVITEGEIDALSCLETGTTPHVVSVPNGAALDKAGEGDIFPAEDSAFRYLWGADGKLKAGLRGFAKIILATDADPRGLILRDELATRFGRPRCWFVTYPDGCKDANEVLVRYGADRLRAMIADAKPMVPSKLVSFSDIPVPADDTWYSSGWEGFDNHFRLRPPQLIVVTGVPNAGKSQWTLALVANYARLHKLKGATLQFEDDVERNREDLLRYAKAWHRQQRGGIHEEPSAWVDRMFKTISPSEDLDNENDLNLVWLKASIEEAAIRHDCKWVLIDPWNEVEHLWGRQDTEATYLNRALKDLKRMARRYRITIIIVAHPNLAGGRVKAIEEASLYDINGGAVWNNKADLGVIVWADDVTAPLRKIKVAKSKSFMRFGTPGIVDMEFDSRKATFNFLSAAQVAGAQPACRE